MNVVDWPGRSRPPSFASTHSAVWFTDAPAPNRTCCAPIHAHRAVNPFTVRLLVLVTVTVARKKPPRSSRFWYDTFSGEFGTAVPSPWSATNDDTHASVEFQLMVSSFVDHDWMSSM